MRAEDGIRTRGPDLGKIVRYHCATSARGVHAMIMNPTARGKRTEAKILGELALAGRSVLVPWGEERYDLALDTSGAGEPSYVAAGLAAAVRHLGDAARSKPWEVGGTSSGTNPQTGAWRTGGFGTTPTTCSATGSGKA